MREDAWTVDGETGCLLPSGRGLKGGPFRVRLRSAAAVDRPTASQIETHSTACLEFAPTGGAWLAVTFRNDEARERWAGRVASAFGVLADTGIGGERSRGWGRFEIQAVTPGIFPDLLLRIPVPAAPAEAIEEQAGKTAYWLLSLFSPAPDDSVDWGLGTYSLLMRAGRVESPAGCGTLKRCARMVSEGSVVVAQSALTGAAPDVAPDGFPHPVYRAGFALGFAIPWKPPAAALPRQRKVAEPAAAPASSPPLPAPPVEAAGPPAAEAPSLPESAAEVEAPAAAVEAAEPPAAEAVESPVPETPRGPETAQRSLPETAEAELEAPEPPVESAEPAALERTGEAGEPAEETPPGGAPQPRAGAAADASLKEGAE